MFYINVLKSKLLLWWQLNFQQSLLKPSVSHDPSEIILICRFAAQEKCIIIIPNVENSCVANILVETVMHSLFNRIYLKFILKIFCNSVTYDQITVCVVWFIFLSCAHVPLCTCVYCNLILPNQVSPHHCLLRVSHGRLVPRHWLYKSLIWSRCAARVRLISHWAW